MQASILLVAAALGATEADARYALWEVAALGVEHDVARTVTRMLTGEMREILGDRFAVTELYVDPDARRLVADCPRTKVCVGEAGLALGADRTIIGVITRIGDQYNLNIKIVEGRTGEDVDSATQDLQGDDSEMLQRIQILLVKLLAPERLAGELVIDADVDGVDVYVDGTKVGQTPLPGPIRGLHPGQHALKLSSDEVEDFFTFFMIHHGKTTTVEAELGGLTLRASTVKRFAIGAKGGYSTNFGAVDGPWALFELSIRFVHNFSIGFESGYTGRAVKKPVSSGGEATVDYWAVPLVARLAYRHPIDQFGIFAGVRGGAHLVSTAVRGGGLAPSETRTIRFAVSGVIGADVRLGPGRIVLEVQYIHSPVSTGTLSGNLGGLMVAAGYLFEL